tara:strand:+ start:120 stop:1151 length:1032 start_codon:yes stop_codon:yes gene_type:complete
MPAEEIMKLFYLLTSIFLFYNFSLSAESSNEHFDKKPLTIYTYDSFVSEWGPGPKIEKIWEENYNSDLKFVSVDSAATLLTKIILEGESTKADIVLGLDMNLLNEAENSNLFLNHSLLSLEKTLNLPIKWKNKLFVPYNYGYFAFVYNNKKFENPPKTIEELIEKTNARIVIQDPRTSTPGLGLLTWLKAIYGDEAQSKWKKLNKKIISVTKGWSDAYYNIFLTGEADLVFSYTTSPAAHVMFEENYDISAINFKEGNYISVEFAGLLKTSNNKSLAKEFLSFMISEEFQSVIPSTNIMYPVIKIENLPEAFKQIEIPKAIQLDPAYINLSKESWINEWLESY